MHSSAFSESWWSEMVALQGSTTVTETFEWREHRERRHYTVGVLDLTVGARPNHELLLLRCSWDSENILRWPIPVSKPVNLLRLRCRRASTCLRSFLEETISVSQRKITHYGGWGTAPWNRTRLIGQFFYYFPWFINRRIIRSMVKDIWNNPIIYH